ncbi:MAG: SDR family NAD(P)-dependent oxidoreductase [Gemmatimonadetes bacterium]|nr:SDR family NAD(P)-dependent oxidoreductase [Gemmatimonadota bacterium]
MADAELAGRVIAITGAARGMGRAFTRGFLAEGAKVVAMDLSWEPTGFSSDEDDSYRRELESRPDDVIVATVDVTNDAQIDAAFERLGRSLVIALLHVKLGQVSQRLDDRGEVIGSSRSNDRRRYVRMVPKPGQRQAGRTGGLRQPARLL